MMSSHVSTSPSQLKAPKTYRKSLKRWEISDTFSIAKVVDLAGITDFRLETRITNSLSHGISIPRNGLLSALNDSCTIYHQWEGFESFNVQDRARVYNKCLRLISPFMLEENLDPAGSPDFSRPWKMLTDDELRLLLPSSPEVRNLLIKYQKCNNAPRFYVTTPRPRTFTWNKPLFPSFITAHNHISAWHSANNIDHRAPIYDYLRWVSPHAKRLSFMGFDCW
jgi:hypothetical protein